MQNKLKKKIFKKKTNTYFRNTKVFKNTILNVLDKLNFIKFNAAGKIINIVNLINNYNNSSVYNSKVRTSRI